MTSRANPRHIAVIDVGKTNAKLALVDTKTFTEIAVVSRPNVVIDSAPYPHFDLEGHWAFFLENLKQFQQQHGVEAISVTTHGAAVVLLDEVGNLATPMLDYEHDGPDKLAAEYDAIRPPFNQTGSPRLPMGLNAGAQLHWLFHHDPTLRERTAHIVTYPQYWGFRLTGVRATDVTSLGCHTDLWLPQKERFSNLVDRLGIAAKLAPAQNSDYLLGTLKPEIAESTGLSTETPVACGIHDSNASLLPHLVKREGAFSVVSTGTWVISMASGAETPTLDPARDTLVNVSAFGAPVPSARFMGGREFEIIRDGSNATPTEADRKAVLEREVMLFPSVITESGPFAGCSHYWSTEPTTAGERIYALSLYLALMTQCCLDLIGGRGPTVVEGPFAQNADFLEMLAALRRDGVQIESSSTGTSIGAALLMCEPPKNKKSKQIKAAPSADMQAYAKSWFLTVKDRITDGSG